MFKNHLKIALRRIRKDKMTSIINVLGLAFGLAAAIVIFLYAQNELTYDRFHKNADDIYLIYKERITPTGTQITRDTWLPMAAALKNDFPSIKNTVRFWDSNEWIEVGNRRFEETIAYADPSIFDIFSFKLAKGDIQNFSTDIHSAIISQEIAERFFGDADPIGQRIRVDFSTDYTVRGVLAEIPQNSTIEIDILVSPESAPFYERNAENWGSSWLYTFLHLQENNSPTQLETQMPQFITKIWGEEESQRTNLRLAQLTHLHNDLTNSRTNTLILLAIAIIILAIASINFMNLTTARSMERAQEIGLRKVMGAERKRLIGQFLSESILISLFALALAVLLVQLILPFFNSLYSLNLQIGYFENAFALLSLFGLALCVGAFAGIYPAFHISRLQPAYAMRGQLKNSPAGTKLRLGLVVAQFCMSIILIIAVGVLWQQMQFMRTANLNFDKENILVVEASQSDFADREQAQQILETFKNELRQHSGVVSVSSSSIIPGRWSGGFLFAFPVKPGEEQRMRMRYCAVDANYFTTFGMNFIQGKNFEKNIDSEAQRSVVLNEAALQDFGWSESAGQQIRIGKTKFDILGVVENYHFDSLEENIEPIIHIYQASDSRRHRGVAIKIAAGNTPGTLDYVRETWQQLVPNNEMRYFFVDENFNLLYENQERLLRVVSVFALLAISIAALGLFALSSLTVVQRTKEIGIRKTLGASTSNVVGLLSKDFVKLVGIANLIAWPVAWFALNEWLLSFAYRIEIGWLVFAISGCLALLIALATISTQAIRAALANPVEALRYE